MRALLAPANEATRAGVEVRPTSERARFLLTSAEDRKLKTSDYIVIETLALSQNPMGLGSTGPWARDVLGVVETIWIRQAFCSARL